MTSYPSTHRSSAARKLAIPRDKSGVELDEPDLELVAYHEYDVLRLGEIPGAPERNRGRLAKDWNRMAEAKASRGVSRFERATEKFGTMDHVGGGVIHSTEIRRGNGRDFDGQKDGGKSDALGNQMRSRVEAQYSTLHHK